MRTMLLWLMMVSTSWAYQLQGQPLELVGKASAYYARVIHVYDATLFGPAEREGSSWWQQPDVALQLCYSKNLKPEDFIKAGDTVLNRQYQADALKPFETSRQALYASWKSVRPGDCYSLEYTRSGLSLKLNGELQVTIEDPEFARIYLGIWLGDEPLSAAVRQSLLGL